MQSRAPRLDIKLSGTLTVDGASASTPAISVNLSESGILVRAARQAPRGTVVQLDFKNFKAEGEVIWAREFEDQGILLGLRFLSLGWRDKRFIRGLVADAMS